MTRYGMAIDLERCVGCQACATACKIANNLPKDITYNTVYTRRAPIRTISARQSCTAPRPTTTRRHFPNCVLNSCRCNASTAATSVPGRVPYRCDEEAR